MTKIEHTVFHVVCILSGLAIMGSDVGNNVDFMYQQTKTLLDTNVLAVIAVALGTALGLTAIFIAIRERKVIMAIMLIVGTLLGAAFSVTATLDRVATLRDQSLESVRMKDSIYVALRSELIKTIQDTATECSPKKGGRGPNCLKGEDQVAALKDQLEKRDLELDSLGKRLATLFPFMSVKMASIAQPLLLPFALFLLGNCLFAFGCAGKLVKVIPQQSFEFVDPRTALEDQVAKFKASYVAKEGREPSAYIVAKTMNLSHAKAKRLLEKAA